MPEKKNHSFFIAGTDTDSGKTHVTCALLETFRKHKLDAIGLKPVASGADESGHNEDALKLQQASTIALAYNTINPLCFDTACAPHIAAHHENKSLSLDTLETDFSSLPPAHAVFIEGVGGWMAPIDYKYTFADYVKKLNIEVILVVGIKLGCLNHSLLTAAHLQQLGIRVKGWIANCINPETLYISDNIDTLKNMLPFPCLGELAFGSNLFTETTIHSLLTDNI